jgi:hypothetical protein
MATYIQGVTDYIPDFQPFQPDYNFYSNVLQAKQNQYDTNYKSLNNLYGQLYYQDVTRDDSNKMKDGYLKNIDFELKRVSGLDLSLDQNVEQAKQVFRPIYENKNLMKDMALTKNYMNERSKATSLLTSKNKEDRMSYWDEGIKDMDYRLEEFKNADASKVLNFSNISYTPYVNATKQYLDMAKEYNLSVDITQPDKSGMYMVRQKNGDLIIPSLQKLFLSAYANDPALQKVKATEAYVKRKDEAKARAPKYNNNEVLAEKEYLKEQFLFLKDFAKQKTEQSEDAVTTSNNKKNSVESDIKSGDVNPFQPAFLQKIAQAIEVDDIVYQHNRNISDELMSGVKTYNGATDITSVEGLDLDNIELARQKVDLLQANYIAEKEIMDAADSYSRNGMIIDYKVNPIGLENMRHSNNLTRDAINNQYANQRATNKLVADRQNVALKWQLDNGYAEINPATGEIVPIETTPQYEEKDEVVTANDGVNQLKHNRKVLFEQVDKFVPEYVDTWINTIKNGLQLGRISKSDLPYLLGQNQEWGPKMWNKIITDYDDPDKRQELIKELTVNQKIFDYRERMDNWAQKNKGLDVANTYNKKSTTSGYKLDKMKTFYDAHMMILKENKGRIINTLSSALKTKGITDDKLRYTIINEYMDKYITGKIYEDSDFNDHLENIFNNFKKKGVNQETPGFFSRVGKFIASAPSIAGAYFSPHPVNMYKAGEALKGVTEGSIISIMNDAYEGVVKNPDHKLGLLSYLPSSKSSATGTTGVGATASSIDVNLGRKDDNYGMFSQFLEDLRKTNFNQADINTHRVSLKGNVLDPDYKVDVNLNNNLKNIMFDLSNLAKNKSQKGAPTVFKLSQTQIGAESPDLGAMRVKNIPVEIIEKYFDKKNAADLQIINDIKTNGITYIAPKSSWNNSLFQSSRVTPTEAILNTGKTIQYIDPSYGHKVILNRDPVTGKYMYNVLIRGIDDEGRYAEKDFSDFAQNFGGNIDSVESDIMGEIAKVNDRIDKTYKDFHRQGFEEGVKRLNESFGSKSYKNAGYKVL